MQWANAKALAAAAGYWPTRSRRQLLQLYMQQASAKSSTAAAIAYEVGQCKGIDSSSSFLCSGLKLMHQQLLQPHMQWANVKVGAAVYWPTRRHRQQQQLPMQRAHSNMSAAAAIAYALGQHEVICSCRNACAMGQCKGIRQLLQMHMQWASAKASEATAAAYPMGQHKLIGSSSSSS